MMNKTHLLWLVVLTLLIAPSLGAEEPKKDTYSLWSTVDIQLYGFLKLDAAYDTARITNGNFAQYSTADAGQSHDDEFNMTVKQTRLGMKLKGPDFGDGGKTSGQLEVDFYGTGAENKATAYMRHGFLKLDWPEDRFSILAGQTWDVISPLNPSTINYSVQWWGGNIGYRRPQIRIEKGFGEADGLDMNLKAALARTIGDATGAAAPAGSGGAPFTPGDTGEDAGYPGLQARLGFSFPLCEKRATIGFSGHYAVEEYDDTIVGAHNTDVPSWSGNVDITVPMGDKLTHKGELWVGKNMNQYLSFSSGVVNNGTTVKPIKTRGGWYAASLGPFDSWKVNMGISAEHVSDHDIQGYSGMAITSNVSTFVNTVYTINAKTQWGFEMARWRTAYRMADDGDSLRFQTMFIFKF